MLGRFLICSVGVLALLCVTAIPGPLQAAQRARGGSRAMRSPNFARPNRGFDRRIFSDPRFGRTNGSFGRDFDRRFDRDFDRGFSRFDRDFDRRFDRRFFDPRFGFTPGFSGFSPGFNGFSPGFFSGFSPGFGGF
jgi:hypothetical protein